MQGKGFSFIECNTYYGFNARNYSDAIDTEITFNSSLRQQFSNFSLFSESYEGAY